MKIPRRSWPSRHLFSYCSSSWSSSAPTIASGLSFLMVLGGTGCAALIGADEPLLGDPADAGATAGAIAGASGVAGAAGTANGAGGIAAGAAGAGAAGAGAAGAGAAGAGATAGAGGSPSTCASGPLGEGSQGPSCDGLASNCGPSANESCCRNLKVPGNATGANCQGDVFYRDYDAAGDVYKTQSFPASVNDFYLDRFEVTVGRFKKFMAAADDWRKMHPTSGEGANPLIPGSGWNLIWPLAKKGDDFFKAMGGPGPGNMNALQTWVADPSHDNLPIDGVSWYTAFAFCLWDEGRLPTEAEWMYAAAGGEEQRAYPWSVPASSTTISAGNASYSDGTNCTGDGQSNGCSITDFIKVGTKPAGDGRWGHADLAGNVWEWVFDAPQNPYPNPCVNCGSNQFSFSRSIRGGNLDSSADKVRVARRDSYDASKTFATGLSFGIRCARN